MTTRTKRDVPIEHYIERAKALLLEKYPELSFEVRKRSPKEAYLYFFGGPYDTDEDGWDMSHTASDASVDAVVDHRYLLHVLPRD